MLEVWLMKIVKKLVEVEVNVLEYTDIAAKMIADLKKQLN